MDEIIKVKPNEEGRYIIELYGHKIELIIDKREKTK